MSIPALQLKSQIDSELPIGPNGGESAPSDFMEGLGGVAVAAAERGDRQPMIAYLGRLLTGEALAEAERPLGRPETLNSLTLTNEEVEHVFDVIGAAYVIPGIKETEKLLIDADDMETVRHQARVAFLVAAAGSRSNDFTFEEVVDATAAALIHDVGKRHERVRRATEKKGPWSTDDREDMKWHVRFSVEDAEAMGVTNERVLYLVDEHHDAFRDESKRYKLGVPEAANTLLARLLVPADELDALLGPRIYRRDTLTPEEAMQHIEEEQDIPETDMNLYRGLFTGPRLHTAA